MDTKHTPQMGQLPWKIGRDHFVVDAQSHFVCVSGFHHTVAGGDYIPSKLNAAFIVRAVNSHDQLVAALEMLLANIEEHRGIAVTSFDAEEFASAALAAAAAEA